MSIPEAVDNNIDNPPTSQELEAIFEELGVVKNPKQKIGFTYRIWLQSLFPYRSSKEKELVIEDGPLRISIYSSNGLPHGKYPRLIMAYIMTEAVRRQHLPENERRIIPLGASLNEFLRLVGVTSRGTGGAYGTIKRINEQVRRIASTRIQVEQRHRNHDSGAGINFANSWGLWYAQDNPDQLSFHQSYLELSEEFYNQIIENPIPIDLDILRSLVAPRAMDVFAYISTKKYSQGRTETVVSWEDLYKRFTVNKPMTSASLRDFRREMAANIEELNEKWEGSNCRVSKDGLHITPGSPSVAIRPSRRGTLRPLT